MKYRTIWTSLPALRGLVLDVKLREDMDTSIFDLLKITVPKEGTRIIVLLVRGEYFKYVVFVVYDLSLEHKVYVLRLQDDEFAHLLLVMHLHGAEEIWVDRHTSLLLEQFIMNETNITERLIMCLKQFFQ